MMSQSSSRCQEQVMMTKCSLLLQKVCHYLKKCQNVCHDVNNFVMTSKTGIGVKNMSNVCHEVKNTSWCQQVCHEVKTCHDVRKFAMPSKIRHNVKRPSWLQKVKNKSSLCHKVRQDVTKFIMMTIGSSLLQKVRHDVKKMSWCHKVIMIDVKNTS